MYKFQDSHLTLTNTTVIWDLHVHTLSRFKAVVSYFFSFFSLLSTDHVDSLQVEMSGLLKELHCPYKEVSGILKGGLTKTKDHLKFVCM